MALSDLTWTTRETVAAELLAFLRGTHPHASGESDVLAPPRARVAALLAITATPLQQEELLKLALDPSEHLEVRRNAVWGLDRTGADLPAEALDLLLGDPDLCRDECQLFGAADLLALARTPEAEAVARRYLQELRPAERAALLASGPPGNRKLPDPLHEWLYGEWLEYDRQVLAGDRRRHGLNREVIRATRSRRESRQVLQELWRSATGEERQDMLDDLEDDAQEWSFPDPLSPGELEELTRTLALPSSELVARLGRLGLVTALERALAAEHRSLSVAGRRRRTLSETAISRLRVLWHWQDPAVDAWLAAHAVGKRLHPELRWWLMHILSDRNPGLASAALTAVLRAGDHDLPLYFLRWIARKPAECHRELLREALQPERPQEIRCLGLCGLDRLGGEDPLLSPEVLQEIAHDPELELRLRLRALGALARRGNRGAKVLVTRHATENPDLLAAAEAVALLGETVPEEALPILTRALREERRTEERICAPAAEEAALALARLATPEARTFLLRAYLRAETQTLRHALEDYLPVVIDTLEGERPRVDYPILSWRRIVHWPWSSAQRSTLGL